ncbi:hypothetical protein CRG98_041126 [Punica granatum]|uniref:PB1-like domain-containing protein n=1 Tax=Punica granatum TaxID=22663 RepID=A0A2I0I3C1_PUNGR|nr:hypothetical protein CRG98_041126 [Punica granatum]
MHHGEKFVRDPILRYEGGVVEVKKDEDIDKFTTVGVLDMLGNTYKTKLTACFYQNPIFSDLDVGLEPLASDDDARLLFNILAEVNEPCKEVHSYFEHNVVDVLEEISLDEEMQGSTTDGIYRGRATFSSAAASATAGTAAGASTSDANLEEE